MDFFSRYRGSRMEHPEFDDLFFRPLSVAGRSKMEAAAGEVKTADQIIETRWAIIADSLVTESGEQVFREADKSALAEFKKLDAETVDKWITFVLEISGLADDDLEESEKEEFLGN